MTIAPWLTSALIAGIAGAPHCLGMCGPLATAAGDGAPHQGAYHLGRIGTYAALGALAGAAGRAVPGPDWLASGLAGLLLVGFALSLAGVVPEPARAAPGLARAGALLARRTSVPSRLLFGGINGLLPCGLVYATLAIPMAASDPVIGALAMATFGLATVPALAAATLGLRALLSRSMATRRVLAAVVLASGLATLGYRDGWFSDRDGEVPACHAP
ncbi:MAG TPA: sulfite exporter TauE/SafE family protein [Deltaproteobacteria bacterium]|nr:sulfite exporter TauE/SafE family protein [Deltaproteobacteria bacterium]